MSDEDAKTPEASDEGPDDPRPEATDEQAQLEDATEPSGTPEEPIEAEFEPADGVWARVTDRHVSMPVALALAAGAAVAGGLFGAVVNFGGGGGGMSAAQIDAAVDSKLAPYDARLRNLVQTMADSSDSGGGVATAALNDLSAQIAAVRDTLTAVDSRLRVVETASGDENATAALAAQLDDLASQIADARQIAEEAMAAPSAQAAEVESLSARVSALSDAARAQGRAIDQLSDTTGVLAGRLTGVAAPAGRASEGAAAALAFASLQEGARGGGPFVTEAADAAPYFSGNEDMDALVALAETGAPTPAALAASFRSAARAAREAEQPEGGGFVDRLGRAVAGLVTVRRLDAPETDTTGDVLVRAQRRLLNDDLAGAADELDRLEGPSKAAVETWVGEARARVEIDSRLEALRRSFSES